MKALPLIFSLILTGGTGMVMAQEQIENPGFELWEDAGTVTDEPVDWSSIKTSDNDTLNPAAPLVWGQSTDAHSGNYSVQLTNKGVFGIVATGTLTNGRVHPSFDPNKGYVYTIPGDPRWSTPFTGRPDSVTGWYKYYPLHGDRAKVTALLHIGAGALPEHGTQANWVAKAEFVTPPDTVDTWTRFSAPFVYFLPDNPEFILMVLTAGFGTEAVDSSSVLYDDLAVVFKPGGINANTIRDVRVYGFDGRIYVSGLPDEYAHEAVSYISDTNGRVIFSGELSDGVIILPVRPPAGLYICTITCREMTLSRKIVIN